MTVELDPHSGFCGGVIRAIGRAERFLDAHPGGCLYSLGEVVHNEAELRRLGARGLVTLSSEDLEQMAAPATGETLLIRAHGEPPGTYALARKQGFEVIDCTCPVVLEIQKNIREAYVRLQQGPDAGRLLIFGKIGHAEVLGLVGQVDGDALVVEDCAQAEALFANGTLQSDTRLELFSQTTMSPDAYEQLIALVSAHMTDPQRLTVHRTICSQVASRHRELSEFALQHDVVVFVSGRESSNGRVLCALCKAVNIRTHHISAPDELQRIWFHVDDRVGVCGATSTPLWLLEEVAARIKDLQ